MRVNLGLESRRFGIIRAVHDEKGLLFCATDVARALGYKKPNNAVHDHCDNVVKMDFPTSGGMQAMSFITPAAAWCFCHYSNQPGSEALKSYLFNVAMPVFRDQIRKATASEAVSAPSAAEIGFSHEETNEDRIRSHEDQLTEIGAKAGALVFARAMMEFCVEVLVGKFGFPFENVRAAVCALFGTEPKEYGPQEAEADKNELNLDDFLGALYSGGGI